MKFLFVRTFMRPLVLVNAPGLGAPINKHFPKLIPRFKARVSGATVFGVVG
jgi:hypothetical protein